MKTRTLLSLATLTLSLVVAACGASAPAPAAPSGASEALVAEAGAPASWHEATTEKQKGAFMKAHVTPRMREVFQAHDAAQYAQFDCKSCHGKPFQPKPADALPKLTLKDGELTAFAEHPEMSKFMAEKVTPAMAELLGEKPYDPKTHQGFGCGGCHKIQ
jgi:hypothetical protein